MAFNGSGTFNRLYKWVNDAAASVKILATRMDDEMDGFAAGLSTCVTKDGQTTPTANLPMGGFIHTGVGNATATNHYPATGQVQNDSFVYGGTGGGTADVITITTTPATTAYAAGQRFKFISSGANTTNVTLNVNGLGAKAVTKHGTTALAAGDIPSGGIVHVEYDGTRFQLMNVAFAAVPSLSGNNTLSGTNTFSGTVNLNGNVSIGSTINMANAVLQGAIPLVFEGATDNGFETFLAVTDPTADRTLSIPNASGEICLLTTATQAQQETATANTAAVTPGTQQYHPSSPKAWIRFNGTGTVSIAASYNVTSLTDNGTGDYTVTFTTAFSAANYAVIGLADTAIGVANGNARNINITSLTTTACRVLITDGSSTSGEDQEFVSLMFFGDQ